MNCNVIKFSVAIAWSSYYIPYPAVCHKIRLLIFLGFDLVIILCAIDLVAAAPKELF